MFCIMYKLQRQQCFRLINGCHYHADCRAWETKRFELAKNIVSNDRNFKIYMPWKLELEVLSLLLMFALCTHVVISKSSAVDELKFLD